MKITLKSREGQFVAQAEIPPFNTPPEVIVWGDRVFQRWLKTSEYHEVFCYWCVVTDAPAKPEQPPTPEGT